MKVQDILRQKKQRDLITVGEAATLLAAARLLREHNIGVLLVTGSGGKPVGILSERDIVRRFASEGAACEEMAVADVMTRDVVTGTPADELADTMRAMTEHRFRHLPILDDDGETIGLVSIGDVVKSLVLSAETELEHLWNYITGSR